MQNLYKKRLFWLFHLGELVFGKKNSKISYPKIAQFFIGIDLKLIKYVKNF
jgi:intergrase/recombinase